MDEMKEQPIIFTGESVKAILEGRKTQTRRVIKLTCELDKSYDHKWVHFNKRYNEWEYKGRSRFSDLIETFILKCPYGQAGDRLWVREKHHLFMPIDKNDYEAHYWTEADDWQRANLKWRPSIHMHRWASWITLEITKIEVERLQDIVFMDIQREGIWTWEDPWKAKGLSIPQCRMRFANLWDSLNAKRDYGWETNPWVWVISYINKAKSVYTIAHNPNLGALNP